MYNNNDSRPKVDWTTDKVFENKDFVIQLNKLPLKWPRYSMTINVKGKDDKVSRFIPMRVTGQGKVTITSVVDSLSELIMEAEEYVEMQFQILENDKLDRKIAYEERDVARTKPKAKKGLKQLGKQDGFRRNMREVSE